MRNLVILYAKKQQLKEYCIMKLEEEDFHGVADAAMDLRELDVEIKLATEEQYKKINPEKKVK